MKHLKSKGEYHVQLLAELIIDTNIKKAINNKFFDMWKRMLKKDFEIDFGQITLPQLVKESIVELNEVNVTLTGIGSHLYKIRVWKPTYTLITSLELAIEYPRHG